ncbi:MAG: hypothetical protein QXU32_07900 [Nitrososphaerales archaeon]
MRESNRMRYPVRFQKASSLMGLNSGIKELDKLIGFIVKGSMVFIKGSRSRKHILELLCLRSIIQHQNYCIFIDGGNSFDPYLLTQMSTAAKHSPKEVLHRVIIARAFTCHQLISLINEAGNIIDIYPSNFIAVSDILHLFTSKESDVDIRETEFIMHKIIRSLHILKQKDAIAAVTSYDDNKWFDRMIESYSDIVLTVNDSAGKVSISLDKHPLQKGSIELASNVLMLNCEQESEPLTLEQWVR